MSSSLPPRESAELYFSLAQTVVSLYHALLRCQGTDPSKHSIHLEEERLLSYATKLSVATDEGGSRNPRSIDVDAVERMITHHTEPAVERDTGNPAKRMKHSK